MPLVTPRSRKKVDATVFIPTFNGEKYLDRLIYAVEAQEFDGNFEILIIDSGSSDATLDIIDSHRSVRLVQIPNSDFGHGKTRNQASQLSRGTYIAFLTQDAIPADPFWLGNLTAPLRDFPESVKAVVGRQYARKNCFPLMKQGIDKAFKACGPIDSLTFVSNSSRGELSPSDYFYSDVNSATLRDFLNNEIPYRDVAYSEDYAFAEDVLNAGYTKVYQPFAAVEHSNDLTIKEFSGRMFDESLSVRNLHGENFKPNFFLTLLRSLKDATLSTCLLVIDKDISFREKTKWFIPNLFYVFAKWIGIYRALSVSLSDLDRIQKYSLESSNVR